jgi:glyoxylase-like metal-dependent hydrolase (beta-lactamase superfamily II)
MNNESFPFQVGSFECIVVSDGTFAYPHPAQLFFTNAPKERLEQVLKEQNLVPEQWEQHVTPYLCLVINTGQNKVLVDTGAGGLAPTTGKLIPRLQAEGISADEIDTVILTHGHPDHIGGSIDSEGRPSFPNARYIIWKDEWDFWTSNPDLAEMDVDEHIKGLLLEFARKNLPSIKDRLDIVNQEREIVPGIRVVPAPGHTPGHMAVAVASNSEQLLHISDAVLLEIHLEHPNWYAAVDFAPQKVIATRCWLLDLASTKRSLVLATHFPFPGLGYVIRKEEGWQWHPIETVG